MAPLHHPNLVKLVGGCWNAGADKLCLVLEFCSKGSLRTAMNGKSMMGTWENPRFQLARGLVLGFKHLHHGLNEPIIHRDLKPDNVLVTEDMQSKVADFGESKIFEHREALLEENAGLEMTMVGTLLYCAPEASVVCLRRSLS